MTLISRRQFGKLAALAGGATTLAGCAPWEQADPEHEIEHWVAEPLPTPLEWRILNRLGFGPRPGDLARLRAMGVETWIQRQLQPESIVDPPELAATLDQLESLNLSVSEARDRETELESDTVMSPVVEKLFKIGKQRIPPPGPVRQELCQAAVLRATYSQRSLQEALVEFWSDHFNIDQAKGDCRWLKTVDDALLRPHALGKFRDLLGASAHSPAMLYYLDNAENHKADRSGGSRLNENYARELLELHTLGDTSVYSQRDIEEVARVFTGWTIADSWSGAEGEFAFHPADHDDGGKLVLGAAIPAGGGARDGEELLDRLARHPATARAITKKLCLRFLGVVSGDLHKRLVGVYLRSDGDIRAVLAALLAGDEFRAGTAPLFKRPFQFTIAALRTLGVRTSGAGIPRYLESMGQRPFNWARPDGYPQRPEFWAGGLLARWQFALDLAQNKIDETWINVEALARATRGQAAADVCRQLAQALLGTPLAPDELRLLAASAETTADMLPQWLALLLISPQFQWC